MGSSVDFNQTYQNNNSMAIYIYIIHLNLSPRMSYMELFIYRIYEKFHIIQTVFDVWILI